LFLWSIAIAAMRHAQSGLHLEPKAASERGPSLFGKGLARIVEI
jgi:hypothetical protein